MIILVNYTLPAQVFTPDEGIKNYFLDLVKGVGNPLVGIVGNNFKRMVLGKEETIIELEVKEVKGNKVGAKENLKNNV